MSSNLIWIFIEFFTFIGGSALEDLIKAEGSERQKCGSLPHNSWWAGSGIIQFSGGFDVCLFFYESM